MGMVQKVKRAGRVLRRDGFRVLRKRVSHELRSRLDSRSDAFPFLAERPPGNELLGMTSVQERRFLHWYTRTQYQGLGAIVDLGCWLGSSTISLAQGLEASEVQIEKRGRIHAYDLFEWFDWMSDNVLGTELAGRYGEGESFLEEYERRIGPWAELIETHAGDLAALGWTRGERIEILFNDVSKSWELAAAVLHDFYPSLVPGESLVVEQDFAHFYTSWVHLIRYRLRPYFEPVYPIPYSGSMVFRYSEKAPRELLEATWSFDEFEDDEIDAAFDYSLSLVGNEMRSNVLAAWAMCYLHRDYVERAGEIIEEAVRSGNDDLDMARVRGLYSERAAGHS